MPGQNTTQEKKYERCLFLQVLGFLEENSRETRDRQTDPQGNPADSAGIRPGLAP
jgi:hypothetical protein